MFSKTRLTPVVADPPVDLRRHGIPDLPSADELVPFLRRIDATKWYANFGPLVQEFEQRLLAKLQNPAASPLGLTTLSSGYHALVIGLKILGVKPGDQVLVPAITFPACPLAAQHNGATTILADVDETSWMLTPDIARRVAARTQIAAVMPVALYGAPVPVAGWDDFTRDTGIPVIIDAAASLGRQNYLQHGLVAHSLHATKPFGIGEGGLLIGPNADQIAAAREYSNFGTRERLAFGDGENAKLSEYHAAVGLAQLQRWDSIVERRQQVYALYRQALPALEPYATPYSGMEQTIVSLMMLRLAKDNAAMTAARLTALNIPAHRTYMPPLYRHPYYAGLAVANAQGALLQTPDDNAKARHMTVSHNLNDSVIGMPFHGFMNAADVRQIVDALSIILR